MMIRGFRARNLVIQASRARFHTSSYRFNDKKPQPQESSQPSSNNQIDDADLFAHKLNSQPYYAKRDPEEYDPLASNEQGSWGNGEQEQFSQAEIKKQNEKAEAMKGLAQGVLVLAALFGGFELYQKYPNVKIWWYNFYNGTDLNATEFEPPKKKKTTVDLPVIKNPNDSSVPGLYIWGENTNKITGEKEPDTKWPIRHPWFDGKYLKSVTIGENSALAIDPKGDLIQWGKGFKPNAHDPEYTIKGEGLKMAKISNGAIYALNKKNELLVIPESAKLQGTFNGLTQRSWLLTKYTKPYNKISLDAFENGEKIKDFKTGKNHLIVLTDKGRTFASATGFKQLKKSQGQFGIPEFSQFSKPPFPNTLHEISLLNNSIEKNQKGRVDRIEPRFIQKIAVGNYHTLALDSNGEVYSFGQNTFGQLGQPVNYDSEFISIPKKIELFGKHVKRDQFAEVVDINAGGDTSFCVINPVKMFKLVRGSKTQQKLEDDGQIDSFTVGFGSNLKGQIGNGHYVHAQFDPVKIKELSKFEDFNEDTKLLEKIKVESWTTGQDHTFIKLANNDVLYWGGNDNGQLGNGKKNRIPKPTTPPALIEPNFTVDTYKDLTFMNRLQLNKNQEIVANGTGSAIFYKK